MHALCAVSVQSREVTYTGLATHEVWQKASLRSSPAVAPLLLGLQGYQESH